MPSPRTKAKDSPARRWTMIIIGWALMIVAPLIGWLPGPGGLILFPLGLAILLKHSLWAKRVYSRASKRHPEYALWANWAMGRKRFRARPDLPPIKRDILHLFRRDDDRHPPA
jgi:hypothetical protein